MFIFRLSNLNNNRYNHSYDVTFQTEIEVYRKSSSSQPSVTDRQIDWEETVYLNLILQHVSKPLFLMLHC